MPLVFRKDGAGLAGRLCRFLQLAPIVICRTRGWPPPQERGRPYWYSPKAHAPCEPSDAARATRPSIDEGAAKRRLPDPSREGRVVDDFRVTPAPWTPPRPANPTRGGAAPLRRLCSAARGWLRFIGSRTARSRRSIPLGNPSRKQKPRGNRPRAGSNRWVRWVREANRRRMLVSLRRSNEPELESASHHRVSVRAGSFDRHGGNGSSLRSRARADR
jgi:hypothetical protein